MMDRIAWLLLALVHAAPAISFFWPSMLTRLYGVNTGDALFLLIHHRAALFLTIFVICIWCAISTAPRRLGVVAVAISMLSFLLLYFTSGSPEALRTIAIADLIGIPALLYATWQAFAPNQPHLPQ